MIETKMNVPEKSMKESVIFTEKKRCYVPKRYILTWLGFFGVFNMYTMRVNLSVAIVAMVNRTESISGNLTPPFTECSMLLHEEVIPENQGYKGEQYDWSAKTQASVLEAFFYGYVVSQLPGGMFSERFGAKWLFGGGVLVTSIFTILTPLAASWGVSVLIAVRVLEGLGEGVTLPAMNVLISRWSPKLERSRVSTIMFIGGQIGNVISMPISGWLSNTDLLGGWPSVFYVFGTIGCIWFLVWAFLIHETPMDHPSISKEELFYFDQFKDETTYKKVKTPWKSIFTSLPMWAVVVSHVGQNFGFMTLLTELPSYLSTILHFDIASNGGLSAIPYIAQAITALAVSYLADKLRKSKRMSITSIRKIINSIGLLGPAICLIGVTLAGCRPILIVALISLAMALNGFIYSGYNVTHVDMSPDFAGTLFGITNAISNICGIIGPAIVGAITSRGATIANWNKIFYITAAMYVGAAAFYAIFASAEVQPWGLGQAKNEECIKKDITLETKS